MAVEQGFDLIPVVNQHRLYVCVSSVLTFNFF